MTAIEELKHDASDVADSQLGKIITDAYANIGMTCSKCDYPQNAEDYETYKFHYVTAKLEYHRQEKMLDGRWKGYGNLYLTIDDWRVIREDNFRNQQEIRDEMYRGVNLQRKQNCTYADIVHWKDLMREIKPCCDCKKKFNPTHRIKYDPHFKPKKSMKGFLDYE